MAYEPIGQGKNIIYGIIAGIIAGLVFSILLVRMNMLPELGKMIGIPTPTAGFGVHILVSIIAGGVFAIIFYRPITNLIAGLIYGIVYGCLWWLVGPLTLLPIFLGKGLFASWNVAGISAALPSLVGHIIFGLVLGLIYALFRKCKKGSGEASA